MLSFLAFFRRLLAFAFFLLFLSLFLRSGLEEDDDEDDVERLLFLFRFFFLISSLNEVKLLSFSENWNFCSILCTVKRIELNLMIDKEIS